MSLKARLDRQAASTMSLTSDASVKALEGRGFALHVGGAGFLCIVCVCVCVRVCVSTISVLDL